MIDSEDYDEFDLDVYIENNPEGPQVVIKIGPCENLKHAYVIAEELYFLLNHRNREEEFIH